MVSGMYCMSLMVMRHVVVFPNLLLLLLSRSHCIEFIFFSSYFLHVHRPLFSSISTSLTGVCIFVFSVHSSATLLIVSRRVINRCDNRQNECQLKPINTVRNCPIKTLRDNLKPRLSIAVLITRSPAAFHSIISTHVNIILCVFVLCNGGLDF